MYYFTIDRLIGVLRFSWKIYSQFQLPHPLFYWKKVTKITSNFHWVVLKKSKNDDISRRRKAHFLLSPFAFDVTLSGIFRFFFESSCEFPQYFIEQNRMWRVKNRLFIFKKIFTFICFLGRRPKFSWFIFQKSISIFDHEKSPFKGWAGVGCSKSRA